MTGARVLQNTFAVMALTSCLAAAQTSVPSVAFRQPLDDAWWTGPLLAPNASTLPQGHVLVEPYVWCSSPFHDCASLMPFAIGSRSVEGAAHGQSESRRIT